MKLTFIGCGSASSRKNRNSNMVLEVDEPIAKSAVPGKVGLQEVDHYEVRRLLLDCGRTAPEALHDVGLNWWDVDAVYVSHSHNDHVGSMEDFAFQRFFVPRGKSKPVLFGDSRLLDDLWNFTLKGGLASIENAVCTLSTFFNVQGVSRNGGFTFAGHYFQLIQTIHIMDGYSFVPSYGLKFRASSGRRVFITTDTQHCPSQIGKFYADSDVIFQDCETIPNGGRSGVHAHYEDLKTLPSTTKAKMWLYHYNDGDKPDCKLDGFAGWVEMGQTFDLEEDSTSPTLNSSTPLK